MAKIFILIALLLQLCTIIRVQEYPCSEYYTYTFEPGTNKPMGQIEIPSPPKNGPYNLKVGFHTNSSKHKKSLVRLDTAQPLGDALEGVKQSGSLLYHIHFKTETIPTLTKLWFNQRQLCPIPGETEQVATTFTISKRISVSGPISPEEEPSSQNGQSHNNRSYNNNQGWQEADQCGRAGYANELVAEGESTNPAQWPWLVALFVPRPNLRYQCAGSVLTTRHVITAAHCFKLRVETNDIFPASLLVVALGRFNLSQWRERGSVNREVSSYTIHPEYAYTISGDSDLAILTLVEPVEFSSFIKPVCLWTGSDTLQNVIDNLGYVVGWGKDEHGNFTDTPWMVKVPIVSQETCLRSNQGFFSLTSNRTFCAGFRNSSGPCNGDSGSGLVLFNNITGRYYLRGLVSKGIGFRNSTSCDLQHYVVYVDVAQYVPWIVQQISTTELPSQPETTATPLPVPTLNTKRPSHSTIATPIFERPHYNEIDCGRPSTYLLDKGGMSSYPAEWPWLVALFVLRPNLKYQCAGTVLTTRHVITAARCLKWGQTNDTIPANLLEVALGRFNLRQWREEGSVNREIYNYTIHPDYAYTISGDSDLAILTLVEPVEFSPFIKPVCLWTGSDTLQNVIDKLGFVVGWEKDEDGNYSGTPRMEKMSIVNQEECLWLTLEVFFNLTTSRTFCAGARERRGLYGYSGSALTIFDDNVNRFQLRGIFSTAWYFPYSSVPYDVIHVVYVDVAKYKTWIEEQISTT